MITVEELKRYLNYEPETGIFTWKEKASRSTTVGSRAGNTRPDGYVVITLKGRKYLAHRLAWLYVYGVWPTCIVDHIDRNPNNNRISNLRDVTAKQSSYNTGMFSTNSSGVKGVGRSCGKWQANLSYMGEKFYLGTFNTAEEAASVLQAFKNEHGLI